MASIRENLLASRPKITEAEIDGVDGKIRIREMRYGEFRSLIDDDAGDSKVIASCLVDESGGQVLTIEDVDALPMSVKHALVKACIDANGGKSGN